MSSQGLESYETLAVKLSLQFICFCASARDLRARPMARECYIRRSHFTLDRYEFNLVTRQLHALRDPYITHRRLRCIYVDIQAEFRVYIDKFESKRMVMLKYGNSVCRPIAIRKCTLHGMYLTFQMALLMLFWRWISFTFGEIWLPCMVYSRIYFFRQ